MLDRVMEQLSAKEGFYSEPGTVSDAQIVAMERDLGVTLPDVYRQFLRQYAFAEWFGHVVCGISADKEDDAGYFTKKARALQLPDSDFVAIPRDGVVIAPYAGGGYYVLFSKESPRAGEVALFSHDELGREVQHWSSFEDFLRYLISVSR